MEYEEETDDYVYNEDDEDNEDEEEYDDPNDEDYDPKHTSKQGTKKKSVPKLLFIDPHPQLESHYIHKFAESKSKVPNFTGGALPRRDKGNREEYCQTMLTLFKPWRSGLDLKNKEESWDDAFESHKFTLRQKQVMDFFQIKYEFNDARDDFSAQRKQQELNNSFGDKIFSTFQHELDGQHDEDEATANWGVDSLTEKLQEEWDDIGKKQQKRLTDMYEMHKLIQSTGWLSPCQTTQTENAVDSNVILSKSQKEWKATLAREKDMILAKRDLEASKAENNNGTTTFGDPYNINEVKLVSKAYLEYDYHPKNPEDRLKIDEIAKTFTLNNEQSRAFKIIANHAVTLQSEQLKMYLGGIDGTGKSQVIKAMIQFFEQRQESYKFLIMAPTGAAAALIGGSTYHSMLAINKFQPEGGKGVSTLADIRIRLQHVRYIFFDEVSMVDCNSLYNISAQMSSALKVEDQPFGGVNIILAGDFAQLPPPAGSALYSQDVDTVIHTTHSHLKQKACLGKASMASICDCCHFKAKYASENTDS